MHKFILAAVSSLALSACGMEGQEEQNADTETASRADAGADYGYETYADDNLADTMASSDQAYMSDDSPTPRDSERVSRDASDLGSGAVEIPDAEERPTMQAQVILDRRGFGPGVIDGKMGMSTQNALRGFQGANGLEVTGKLDEATKEALSQWERIPATRVVTVPQSWGEETYKKVPDDPAEQAKMERLGYNSLDERLAERFHTTVDVLKRLNPGGKPAGMQGEPSGRTSSSPATVSRSTASPTPSASATRSGSSEQSGSPAGTFFKAGEQVRVPNIGADRIAPGAIDNRDWQRTLASLGVGSEQPTVDRVVVSKSEGTLKAYSGEELVALFTVTSGSEHDPLPLGNWKITGIAKNTPFSYDPELFWDVPDTEEKQQLPPGPNGPVGVVWIDLSKEHYGIHGTPEPQTIGRTQSHGCVRLTNWDAARLAEMVSQSTKVEFVA